MALDPASLPLARLHCTQTFIHVREYVHLLCVLAPNILTTQLVETIMVFHHFHPLAKVDFPPFVDDIH
jgi:hypothetical protein